MSNNKTSLFVLLGPNGTGKTTIINKISLPIYKIQSNYKKLNTLKLSNTTVLSKWPYLGNWFKEVLNAHDSQERILLSDRCPVDSAAYVESGNIFLELILQSFSEMKKIGIETYFIYIRSSIKDLISRLEKRKNTRFHSTDTKWIQNISQFYENNSHYWHYCIDNDESPENILEKVENIIINNGFSKLENH